MSAIELINVNFGYGNGFKLDITSIVLGKEEAVALCGPNGAGKTTLLKIAASILEPEKGDVLFDGIKAEKLGRRGIARVISYVPQSYDETFDFTAGEIVAMGRRPYTNLLGVLDAQDKAVIKKAMERFGVSHKQDKSFNSLSGGEKRAVLIARAYAQEAKWVLMDEPSAFLDPGHIAMLGACIKELRADGRKVLMVTHDVDFAARLCGRVIFMKDGSAVSDVPVKDITDGIIKKVYGEQVGYLAQNITGRKNLHINY